jgi:plastocyanin
MRIAAYLAVVVLIVVAACGGPTASTRPEASTNPNPTGDSVEVHATGFLFAPDEVTITAGDSITWINDDKILHTITAGTPETPDDSFDRELDGQGTSTSLRFDDPGEYAYFCSRHPHMRGVVRVTALG